MIPTRIAKALEEVAEKKEEYLARITILFSWKDSNKIRPLESCPLLSTSRLTELAEYCTFY